MFERALLYNRLLSSFPPPAFLDIRAVGIDISDSALKLAELQRTQIGFVPVLLEEEVLPEGVTRQGNIENKEQLIATLSALRKKHDIHFVRIALPEEKAYLFETVVPKTRDEEQMFTNIEFQLEENVPIAPSETVFDYDVISSDREGEVVVSVTAFQRTVIAAYQEVCSAAGVMPLSFALEGQAIANAVIPRGDTHTYLIVDFGRTRSGISIVRNGIVGFTSTVDVGGNQLTDTVMKRFGISEEEALAKKNREGFLNTVENKELHDTLMSTVSALRDEINRHTAYWNSKETVARIPDGAISKIILCGGNANLPGLSEYLAAGLNVPVELANVWTNAFSFDEYVPNVDAEQARAYATAIGLALS